MYKLTFAWHSLMSSTELLIHKWSPIGERQLLTDELLSFSDDQPLWQSPSSHLNSSPPREAIHNSCIIKVDEESSKLMMKNSHVPVHLHV